MDPRNHATETAKSVVRLTGHTGGVLALAFTPDRGLLASAGGEGAARLWDVAGPPRERTGVGPAGTRVHSLAFAATGRLLAAGSGGLDGQVHLFDVSDKAPRPVITLRGARGAVQAVAFSPDGKRVAAAGEDRTLRVWELGPGGRGEPHAQLPGHTGTVRAVAFAPDGQGAATASDDRTARLWAVTRIRSWERVALPHPAEVTALAFAADGKTVATGGKDGVIRLWDPTALKAVPRAELAGHAGSVRLLLITPDAGTLVSVGDGPRVMHWDLPGGRPVREWEIPGGPAQAVALTPDGRYLAAGRADGAVDVYRVAEKRA